MTCSKLFVAGAAEVAEVNGWRAISADWIPLASSLPEFTAMIRSGMVLTDQQHASAIQRAITAAA